MHISHALFLHSLIRKSAYSASASAGGGGCVQALARTEAALSGAPRHLPLCAWARPLAHRSAIPTQSVRLMTTS
eukprot:3791528-Pleurochrysis_carterae.AAC.1